MPPPPSTTAGGSTFDKMKTGAMMGAGVGLTIGFIFGSFSILRGGPGPRGAIHTLGQYMAGSAASFAFFLSIGSVIRTQEKYALPAATSPQVLVHANRARWAAASARVRGEQL